ncbi:hypothetical protein AWH48_11335 [Domibacillus aminovorans]|uniref:Uncharacterized protein n=1 Tax=Domibacillus aminovorans TaxID=29332 RepID=A0A177KL68_9BACI|nr:hypothetical protein [Domibacillus aminovorans]OAH53857.1 hypothetical protein AWH48_11335 [Domibacillus aminovorans]
MLYDDEFISKLPEPDKSWKSPLVVYVAKEVNEQYKKFKLYIEEWFQRIDEEKKASYYSRLRSLDDKEFLAQIHEFFVYDFCEGLGLVDLDPELEDGKTPELLWDIQGQKALLDVVTLFDPEERGKSKAAIDELLNYLSEIEHYYNICVWYENIDLHNLKRKNIKRALSDYLDGLDFENMKPEEELIMDDNGLVGTFIPVPRQDQQKKNISFAILGPAEGNEPNKSIEKRIKSKLSKYKWSGPMFVAICKSADFGVDWDDVAEVLYGPPIIKYNPVTREHVEVIGQGGLVMPRGGNAPKNTSLSGVLYCELKWVSGSLPELNVRYLINPYAKYPISLPIPSYPVIDEKVIRFEWSNTSNEDLEKH